MEQNPTIVALFLTISEPVGPPETIAERIKTAAESVVGPHNHVRIVSVKASPKRLKNQDQSQIANRTGTSPATMESV